MRVTFYGVRGSCPCPSEVNRRYGGNTACVALEVDDEPPIVLDLGTGLRFWGETQPADGSFRATALITHLHWDHVQGLPFFTPVDRHGAELDVYGPRQHEGPLGQVFGGLMRPPYFPVQFSELRGDIRFHDLGEEDFAVGNAKVRSRSVPHLGPTIGYRVDWDGASVAYVSDHQAPPGLDTVADSVMDLCDGVDLLIHDAQYTADEFAEKSHWGHCTIDYALLVARQSAVRRLALFHHDPAHSDAHLDALAAAAREAGASLGMGDVVAAREGMCIDLGRL